MRRLCSVRCASDPDPPTSPKREQGRAPRNISVKATTPLAAVTGEDTDRSGGPAPCQPDSSRTIEIYTLQAIMEEDTPLFPGVLFHAKAQQKPADRHQESRCSILPSVFRSQAAPGRFPPSPEDRYGSLVRAERRSPRRQALLQGCRQ